MIIDKLFDWLDSKGNFWLEMVIEKVHLFILHNSTDVEPLVIEHLAYECV